VLFLLDVSIYTKTILNVANKLGNEKWRPKNKAVYWIEKRNAKLNVSNKLKKKAGIVKKLLEKPQLRQKEISENLRDNKTEKCCNESAKRSAKETLARRIFHLNGEREEITNNVADLDVLSVNNSRPSLLTINLHVLRLVIGVMDLER
jgi:hypothetical protein